MMDSARRQPFGSAQARGAARAEALRKLLEHALAQPVVKVTEDIATEDHVQLAKYVIGHEAC